MHLPCGLSDAGTAANGRLTQPICADTYVQTPTFFVTYVQTPTFFVGSLYVCVYVQTPTFLSVNKRRPLEFPSLN